jgi:cytoskeletal protein RodZ
MEELLIDGRTFNRLWKNRGKKNGVNKRCVMRLRRMVGIFVLIGGGILIFIAHYINTQVAQGREEIGNAQQKVSWGKSIFGLTPYSKAIGQKILFDPADQKIQAGEQKASEYETVANYLEIGGIILIAVSLGILFLPNKKKMS